MFPVLNVGSVSIQLPALLLLIGIYLGLVLAEKNAPRAGHDSKHLNSVVLLMALVGIIGSRLSFIAQHFAAFQASPTSIFSLNIDLLDPVGGFIFILISLLIYVQKNNLKFRDILDLLTPLFAVFFVFLGLSQLASGSAYGLPTTLPWGIYVWGSYRHPTQVYQAVAAVAIVLAVYFWSRQGVQNGILFLRFAALTSSVYLFIDAFRSNCPTIFGTIHLNQLAALLLMAIALFLLERKERTV